LGEPVEELARSGHRIVAAGTEWVTPPDAAECKPASAPCTMALERLDGIGRATRIIAACRRKQMTKRHLISPYEQNEDQLHGRLPGR
jgi:hypothetical protein